MNDKKVILKAIDGLKNCCKYKGNCMGCSSCYIVNDVEGILEENDKLKAEIEQLKKRLEIKDNNFELYSNALEEIEQLKAELEQKISCNGCIYDNITISSIETDCHHCSRAYSDCFEFRGGAK